MTSYPVYTPVGIPRYGFNERHVLAAAALTPGDFYQQSDGLIGFYAGLETAAINDPVVFNMSGAHDVLSSATTDVYAAGAAVYFDTVNKYAVTSGSATCLYMGTAIIAKASGPTRVMVALNGNIAPSLSGAATATTLTVSGATTLSGSVAFAGGLTASGATANDFSSGTGTFKTSTGLNTWGGNTACKVGAAVTAAGANQGAATALNEGDIALVIGVTGQTGYGVKFPSASVAGKRTIVVNTTAYACKLYPYSTENIGAGASTAVALTASHAFMVVFSAAGTGYVLDMGAVVTS